MKPGLYIVATPIGNLEDISIRSQKTLGKADIIICENPKHSLKLLAKLGIKKKMYSLHDHNENKIIKKIENHTLEYLVVLISDAGSPLISDPGYKLVRFYIDKKLYVTTVPGPSSVISSLQISGMAIDSFKFLLSFSFVLFRFFSKKIVKYFVFNFFLFKTLKKCLL